LTAIGAAFSTRWSTADTAQILNLSPEAVKTRLHRAHLFLRDRLAGYFTED
jgi:DNA-directed RNA polymerase specialized sigma24 family protein